MIHYHGTPCGGPRQDVVRFLAGRHAFIPSIRNEDLPAAAEVCQSFAFDNGAFSAWKQGITVDWSDYIELVREWHRHPCFDWAIIPDVIDGAADDNDDLLDQWPCELPGVPVWHLHEPLARLERLTFEYKRVALGSSGRWPDPGRDDWWDRMDEAMAVVCEQGRPRCRLHGLRMLDPEIFSRLPLASADSTNAVRNANQLSRFGMYCPPTLAQRMSIIADRIERHQSSASWISKQKSAEMFQ